MRECLTGDDIFAEVLMHQTADARSLLLLEGPDDCDCLAPHVDEVTAHVIPCHGNANLDRVMELVDLRNVERVVAIRDRDWFDIIDTPAGSDNVVYTDLYDLDASILCSTDIARRLSLVFGTADKVRSHCDHVGRNSPISVAACIAAEVGIIRLASSRNGLDLSTRNFPIHDVCEVSHGTVKQEDLFSIVVARTAACPLSADDVKVFVETERVLAIPAERLSSGHDLGAVMSMLLRGPWGGSPVSAKFVLQAARSALACSELHTLGLYEGIVSWERRTGGQIWNCHPAAVA